MWPHKSKTLCLNTSKSPNKFSDFTPDPPFFSFKTSSLCASHFYTGTLEISTFKIQNNTHKRACEKKEKYAKNSNIKEIQNSNSIYK